MKTFDFSGSFVACDLKVGTYIQLIELILKSPMSIQCQGHLLILTKGDLHINLKLNFLRNHFTNQSQILYAVSLGRGNQSLYNHAGHMTKMAAMPIYVVKSFKNQLF